MIKALIILLIMLSGVNADAFLSDTDSHPPPSDGAYEYSPPGTFLPGQAGFPAAGGIYTDPVFGQTVRRITEESTIRYVGYAPKPAVNANSTMAFLPDGLNNSHIYSMAGTLLRETPTMSQPNAENWQWHPTDPDKFLFLTSTALYEYSYASDSEVLVKTFSATLHNGGTAEFTDQAGRYYVVYNGTTVYFYDRTEDAIYTGAPSLGTIDYITIAPDGSGVLVVDTTNGVRWYTVNHSTNVWVEGYTQICDSTPHGDIIKDSDGVISFIADGSGVTKIGVADVDNYPHIYKIPVSNPATWSTLISIPWVEAQGVHISCNIVTQSNRDWASLCFYPANDATDEAPWNTWHKYKAEILLVNVKTGDLRRLAHNRTRNAYDDYQATPRGTISPDGATVLFVSNMGIIAESDHDVYSVNTGLIPPGTITIGAGPHSISIGAGSHTITIGQ